MCEVLRSNFDDKLPEIESNLKEATFIAIDSEFSGLLSNPEYKSSLFDSGNERYIKLKNNIEQFIILQVGITAFVFHRDDNKYVACTFTIPIFPRSVTSVDNKFLCQASSFEFLCRYNFDFNKFAYEGVPYLSSCQEKQVRQELKEGFLFRHLERMSMDDERTLQSECSRVAEWVPSAVQGDTLKLSESSNYQGGKLVEYVLHKELRSRFPTIWTYADKGCVRVEKVCADDRKLLNSDQNDEISLQESLINHFLGFSHVYKLLIELQKPIVGHNLLLDLMIMYNQFYEPLPNNYNDFKKIMHSLFPKVYDTKYISFELKRSLKKDVLDSNVLNRLYNYFKEGRGARMSLYSPLVEHSENYNPSNLESKFHEAGWDSYCTGYCFIRMTHIFAEKHYGQTTEPRPLTAIEHFSAVDSMKNCVNIIRAGVSHIRLDSADPKSGRPRLLHVQANGFTSINVAQVAELFAKFGAVDVKSCSKRRVLVAVGNHKSARDILRNFHGHRDFKVSNYNKLKHSPYVRAALWVKERDGLYLAGFEEDMNGKKEMKSQRED